MKICHINLARGFRGGERQTQLLIESLAQQGFQQTLVCRRGEPLARRVCSATDLRIVEIDKPFLSHFRACKNADVIHAHEGKAAHLAWIANRLLKKPYVLTRRVLTSPRHNFFTHWVYRHAASVVALSSAVERCLQEYDPSLQLVVIPSVVSNLPVDRDRVNKLKKKYLGLRVIGHIGALVNEDKGQCDLIEAARQLSRSYDNLHFILLGQGKDEANLKMQARELTNVEFIGFVDNVGDYLSVFELFAFPSWQEGLGSILLDASQLGVPIVATAVGGIPDIIEHDVNGLLVPVRNPKELASSISRLLDDPGLCQRLVLAGKSQLDRFKIETVSDKYIALYHKLVG